MSKPRINETANHKIAEKKEHFGIKDYRVWKQKSGLLSDNIMESIVKSQSKVKNLTEALNDGERHDRKRIKSYQSTDNYKNKKKDEIQVRSWVMLVN